MPLSIATGILVGLFTFAGDAAEAERLLFAGTRAQAVAALETRLQVDPSDETRLALGVAQILRGVERLGQSLTKAGLFNRFVEIEAMWRGAINDEAPALAFFARISRETKSPFKPFLVDKPTRVDRDVVDGWIAALVDDLRQAEAMLAKIEGSKLRFPVRRKSLDALGFDLDGNGKLEPVESPAAWPRVFAIAPDSVPTAPAMVPVNPKKSAPAPQPADEFAAVVDAGDVLWLRGYCHFWMGFGESVRAVDGKELIDKTWHRVFPNLDSPYAFLSDRAGQSAATSAGGSFVDMYAWIWIAGRLPVYRPEKLKTALAHFERCIACTKEAFRRFDAETDDDHEWIPNPRQKRTVVSPVNAEQFAAWQSVLGECEQVLAGKKLIPHWRVNDGRAVNFRRIFTEPGATFEPLLWVQGSAAVSYLEKGPKTELKFWEKSAKAFGDGYGMLGFAVWFN